MSYTFLWVGLAFAILDWIAIARRWKALEYITNPAVSLALLAWLGSVGGWQGHILWFAIGLAFSMAGDVLLILPKEQLIAGMAAFFLAQIAYIIGLNDSAPPLNLASMTIVLLVGATAFRLYVAISAGLTASGRPSLKIPVLAYVTVISLMLISALLTMVRSEWTAGAAWLISTGALLFFVSDTMLGWNKFVRTLRSGIVAIMVTYHLGQALILLGAVTRFLK